MSCVYPGDGWRLAADTATMAQRRESIFTHDVKMDLTLFGADVSYGLMYVRFLDMYLDRLETEARDDGTYSQAVVSAYRKRLQQIRSASDERDFYALKSLHFEKLQGNRAGDYSMRLNDQWRLILRFESAAPGKTVVIVGIDDYH